MPDYQSGGGNRPYNNNRNFGNQVFNKNSGGGNRNSVQGKAFSNTPFMQNYVDNFSVNDFAKCLSIEAFQADEGDFKNKDLSNSALRNIYDTYLKIYESSDFEIEKEIFFAKIAYQENRKSGGKSIVVKGFSKFLREIYNKLQDKDKFKQFLEVFVAYHKFFNPQSK